MSAERWRMPFEQFLTRVLRSSARFMRSSSVGMLFPVTPRPFA